MFLLHIYIIIRIINILKIRNKKNIEIHLKKINIYKNIINII